MRDDIWVRPFAQVCFAAGRSYMRRSHSMMRGVRSSLQRSGCDSGSA
jgi:hypothetical protein